MRVILTYVEVNFNYIYHCLSVQESVQFMIDPRTLSLSLFKMLLLLYSQCYLSLFSLLLPIAYMDKKIIIHFSIGAITKRSLPYSFISRGNEDGKSKISE